LLRGVHMSVNFFVSPISARAFKANKAKLGVLSRGRKIPFLARVSEIGSICAWGARGGPVCSPSSPASAWSSLASSFGCRRYLPADFAARICLRVYVYVPPTGREMLCLFRCQHALTADGTVCRTALLRQPQDHRCLLPFLGGSVKMRHRGRS
jgi:hypothetical protein